MVIAHRALAPAPPKAPESPPPRVTFFDLPAELRLEIYKLALERVLIHIIPPKTAENKKFPHPLTRTSRQVRQEVLPMIHSMCPISCNVTDFNFDGLLQWINRIPSAQKANLCKNKHLSISICTSMAVPKTLDSMRKWLKYRADLHQPRANWQYSGPTPGSKVCADLRRRAKRMPEKGKKEEMMAMLEALGITCSEDATRRRQVETGEDDDEEDA